MDELQKDDVVTAITIPQSQVDYILWYTNMLQEARDYYLMQIGISEDRQDVLPTNQLPPSNSNQ